MVNALEAVYGLRTTVDGLHAAYALHISFGLEGCLIPIPVLFSQGIEAGFAEPNGRYQFHNLKNANTAALEKSDGVLPYDLRRQWLDVAGVLLNEMYLRTGSIKDLNEAIEHAMSAMNGAMTVFSDEQMHSLQISDKEDNAWGTHTEIGAPSSLLSRFRTNLANYLGDRYLRLGNKDDIDEAIVLMREVIKNTDTSDDLPGRHNNLAALLGDRCSGEGDRGDLAEAVQLATRALGQHPGRHSEEVTRCAMNNLAALLVDNGCTTSNRQRQETDEAIELLEGAINTSPEPSSTILRVFTFLGSIVSAMEKVFGRHKTCSSPP